MLVAGFVGGVGGVGGCGGCGGCGGFANSLLRATTHNSLGYAIRRYRVGKYENG